MMRRILWPVLALLAAAPPAAAQMTPVPLPPPSGFVTQGGMTPGAMPPPGGPQAPAAGAAPQQPAPAGAAQPVSLPAGTGLLLRLPEPAGTVMSADPEVARVQPASPTSLFLMGAAPGRTTVVATTDAGVPIVQYDVTVTPGANGPKPIALPGGPAGPPPGPVMVSAATAAAIRASIVQSIPGAGNVQVRPAGTDVVLSGIVTTAAASLQAEAIARAFLGGKANVLDNLDVLGSVQVNVRVRIAEIDRQITRQLGFNWQALGSGSPFKYGLMTGAAAGGVLSALNPTGVYALNGTPADQLGASYGSGAMDVNSIIDALASDQLITILAEPNLTAQSGETASFLAGGEFPIPVAGYAAGPGLAPEITVQFQPYGVSLNVVPTVLAPNRLNLRIRPEVSQLSSAGAVTMPIGSGSLTIPALTVQRAETTIELGSGQSFAIAGLLKRTSTDIINAFPYLGELPVLGALFRSTQFQRGDTELVIIVTPYIVRPTANPAQLRTPTDHFVPATDLDRILFGRQMASGTGADDMAAALPAGAGFMLK
jgi:pilus assembly protein CpaC